jgi:hypothetical protein
MREDLQNVLRSAQELPPEELPRLLGDLEEIRATALARLSQPPAPAQEDYLLSVEELATRPGPGKVHAASKQQKCLDSKMTLLYAGRMTKQDDPIIRTTIRLPLSLLNAAKHRGIDEGSSFQDVVVRALEQYLAKKGGR